MKGGSKDASKVVPGSRPTQEVEESRPSQLMMKRMLGSQDYHSGRAMLQPPVQTMASQPSIGQIHGTASAGVQGSGGPLPHFGVIQRSFGSHDVSGVKAHVGGSAAEASRQMGAQAYATGNDVAFRSTPDLHTAAHEAAHVVQQRGGVQLVGGVGRAGDEYERHADAVADRVVQGQSAEALLAQKTGGSEGASVQRQVVQRDGEGSVDDQICEATEGQMDLRQARLTFNLAPRTVLGRTEDSELRTGEWGTQIQLVVERDRLDISSSPAIHIDAQWPARNMTLSDMTYKFSSARPSFSLTLLEAGPFAGFMNYLGEAQQQLTATLQSVVGGTAMGTAGYDPFADDNLMQTLAAVGANFSAMPTSGEPVETPEMRQPSIGVTLAMQSEFTRTQDDGSGLRIAAGGTFSAEIHGSGNLNALFEAETLQAGIDVIQFSFMQVSSSAITILYNDAEIARVNSLRVERGGGVTVQDWTPLSPENEGALEGTGRLLANLSGLTEEMIATGLTDGIRQLVQQNRNVLPGLDLAEAMGM